MEGYRAISEWADDLGQKARQRFGCRKRKGYYSVLGRTTFRDVLISVNTDELDLALHGWNEQLALAIDGKTMRSSIDEESRLTHVMGVVALQAGGECHIKKSWNFACCMVA